jgi:hypothetical protein
MLASVGEEFAVWRSFHIGGMNVKALLATLKAHGFSVSDWAEDLMKQKAFTTESTEKVIDTIILTPSDFGYERNPTTVELLDPIRLAQWSHENVERLNGHVIGPLAAEAGPHIRDQYKDQPLGEVLFMAMECIIASGGSTDIFTVERHGSGEQWLDANWASPDGKWDLGSRFVFRLRKAIQA